MDIDKEVLNIINETDKDTYLYGIFGESEVEILESIRADIEGILQDQNIDESNVYVEDIAIYGSTIKGKYKEGSDLDIVLLYSGDMPDYALFDILHETPLYYSDKNGNEIIVDINPINSEEYFTIQDYLDYCDSLELK